MSYSVLIGDNMEAQVSQNTLKSITNQTNANALTKAQISVGDNPISIDGFGDYIYVANAGSDSISLVDSLTNEEVAGMKFDIKPSAVAGQIICDGLDAPINRFLFVSSDAKCIAKPRTGFEFSSWTQNLPYNTNVTISASIPFDPPLAAVHETFYGDPAATLTVNRFGNFTAYFNALPPALPAGYWSSLFTVVTSALIGSLFIPAFVGWFRSKLQSRRVNDYHTKIISVHDDGKLDNKDIEYLNTVNRDISNAYAGGKLSNEHNTDLKNEISSVNKEIFKKRIESLTVPNIEEVNKIRNEITNAYSDGNLNNEHYANLKNEISIAYREIFKKRIESITISDTEAVGMIKNEIKDAYSDGKITELHYNLLIELISDLLGNK